MLGREELAPAGIGKTELDEVALDPLLERCGDMVEECDSMCGSDTGCWLGELEGDDPRRRMDRFRVASW